MADAFLNWRGGLEFGPSNDLRIATRASFSQQRIIRALLTGSAQTNENNIVIRAADNLFAQDWGAGLSRDVEGVSDDGTRADREARAKSALAREPVVDQTQPVNVTFFMDRENSIEYMLVECTSIEGDPVTVALQQ